MTDLDRANQHASKRRAERERDARRFLCYLPRGVRKPRDKRRLLPLLEGGTLQRWTR